MIKQFYYEIYLQDAINKLHLTTSNHSEHYIDMYDQNNEASCSHGNELFKAQYNRKLGSEDFVFHLVSSDRLKEQQTNNTVNDINFTSRDDLIVTSMESF